MLRASTLSVSPVWRKVTLYLFDRVGTVIVGTTHELHLTSSSWCFLSACFDHFFLFIDDWSFPTGTMRLVPARSIAGIVIGVGHDFDEWFVRGDVVAI